MRGADKTVLVFDVGGSHVSASECALPSFALGPIASKPLSGIDSTEGFFDLLHELGVNSGINDLDGVSLAFPGPFDYANGVSQMVHKLPFLIGVGLRTPLAVHFGVAPEDVTFVNDAAAYLMGEIEAGAARGIARVAGLTLGTGIGSAFAVDGVIVTEGWGVPLGGEIWNLPYKSGIVEDVLSTRAIQQNYRNLTGRLESVSTLAGLAHDDRDAQAVFVEFGKQLGGVLRTLLAEFAPDAVVLGGGIARSAHLFLPAVRTELGTMTLDLHVSLLQDRAPLVGAGAAWKRASAHHTSMVATGKA
jgi:glucokinase